MEYFYAEQLRNYRLQFARLFAGFMVKTGKDRNGTVQNRPVPIKYGNISRMVAHIIKQQSENTILSTPVMSFYIAELRPSPERRQYTTHIDTSLVDERKFDHSTNQYTGDIGDRFTVERVMPVPYDLTMTLDIYTSNEYEKDQILEQILMLFNPSVDLQTSSSPLDWTALTYVEMTDDITWDSRQIPVGDTETISVATLKFKMPIWISPPANVTRRKAVETIITNVRAVQDLPDYDILETVTADDLKTTFIITPHDYRIQIQGFKIKLMENLNNVYYDWKDLEEAYTDLITAQSKIIVKHRFGDATGIIGSISKTDDPKVLEWTVDPDSLYPNTLDNINLIIDPTENYPGDGKLPTAVIGQRYLLTDDLPQGTDGWGSVVEAFANDIIEYDGSGWNVAFSSTSEDPEFVTSNTTQTQYRWSPEVSEWQPTIDKIYYPGTWDIIFREE